MRRLKLFFACLLMAVLSIGQVWGEETLLFSQTYPGSPSGYPNSYTGSYTLTTSGYTLTYANINNGTKAADNWTAVRAGRKNNASVARITTGQIATAISKVTITFTQVNASLTNDLYLEVADNANFTSATKISKAIAKSEIAFTISSPAENQYYRITIDQKSGTANGFTRFSGVAFYYEEGGSTPASVENPTFSLAAGTYAGAQSVTLSCATEGATIYYTTDGSAPDNTKTQYTAAISVSETQTIKAIAYVGSDASGVASAAYTILTPQTTMDQIYAVASADNGVEKAIAIDFQNWVVSGAKSNTAYVTDGTKGFIIYYSNQGFETGDILSGIAIYNIKLYNGAAEVVSKVSGDVAVTKGGAAQLNELDEAGMAALTGINTGSLIKINGDCSINGNKYYLSDFQLYNNLNSSISFNSLTAGSNYNCTGVYLYHKTYGNEIMPSSLDDIEEVQPATLTEVDGLAELKAQGLGSYYVNLTNAIVTYADDKNVFIEEANAGSLIYYQNGGHGLEAGDCLNGKYEVNTATYNGKFEITSITAQTGAEKTTAAIPVTTLTIAQLTADFAAYESMRIKIAGVNVTNAIATDDRNGEISDGTNTFILYAGKNGLEAEEDANIDVIGYPTFYVTSNANQHQLAVWAQADITVNVKEDSELAWSANAVELTVGEEFNAPTLQNPNNIDAAEISIESNNIDLATVENGVVSLVENATGEATITATFAGNDQYKAAQVSYTITVNAATPVLTDYYEKVTETAGIVEGTYLIVYEGESVAFDGGLDDSDNDHKLDKASNTIAVDITSDYKIGVTSATEAATFYIDPTAGTIQSASGKYIGVTNNSNGLKTSDNADAYTNSFAIDGDGNAIIGAVFSESTMTLRYNTDSGQKRFRYYKTTSSPAGQLYKLHGETVKADPNLAWDKESIELTVGGEFTSPELSHAQGITGTISYVSDNENVATVENGVISLVAEATGTAHITASYAGDENFKSGSAVCTIKVNPAHSIYVDKLNVNFGSVAKDATVDDQVITVTLTEVPNATATLGGSGASAFSITPAALTASGTITISASSATVGTFNAKLTISDDANEAEAKEVNLKLIVTDPAEEETPISTSTKWVAAVAADLVDGAEVLITGVKDEVTYAMGEQKSTNRAAYVATIDGEGVLTPGEGTMAFTLVAQEGGTFALRTSNGKYLYAAASGSNHLKTQDEVDVNAKWTLTVVSAVAEGSSNRNVMQFNGGNSKLFSCYGSASQEDIQFYVPKPVTPPTPQYETVRENLEENRYYTVCLEKNVTAVKGATFWSLTYRNEGGTAAYLVEETAPFDAGKPYIFQATGDNDNKLEVVYGSDEVNEPVENGALRGTFGGLTTEQLNAINVGDAKVYMIFSNELRPIGTNNHLDAHRAYVRYDLLTVPSTSNFAPGKKVKSMPLQKDVTTGFENINATDKPVKLLIDGNIYILRGEKMYDATGRLVK